MNVVILAGNLAADGETRTFPSGDIVLKLRIAVNEVWKKADGTRQERVDFHSCEMVGQRAAGLAKHMLKGTGVMVRGKLRTDKVGEGAGSKYYTTVRVEDLEFMGGKAESGQRSMADQTGNSQAEPRSSRQQANYEAPADPPIDDDQIPF